MCPEVENNNIKENICKKCNGTGIVKEKNGSIHTCYDCLLKNTEKFDQHGKPKDTGIRL